MRIRPKDRATWRRWFAWHPVIIDNVTVWLEVVERRRHPDIFDWVYGYRTIDRDSSIKRLRLRYTRLRRRLTDRFEATASSRRR
jgi:hypothetical protein